MNQVAFASSNLSDYTSEPRAWLLLDQQGWIRDVGAAASEMFGATPAALAGRHVSTLLPALTARQLFDGGRMEPGLAHDCHIGRQCTAQDLRGNRFAVEFSLIRLVVGGVPAMSLLVRLIAPLRPEDREP
jgi:PAS domain S-box-containing protein